jgi:hypothetical protein
VRLAEAANHGREPGAGRRLAIGQRLQPFGKRQVVTFEGLPDEVVLADAPSEISTARAMSRTEVSATPFSTKSRIAASSMRSPVSLYRCLGMFAVV